MGPTEAEIETRLAELRRRREALDREIADLVLYLELGRRLSGAGPDRADAAAPAPRPSAGEPGAATVQPVPPPISSPIPSPIRPPVQETGPAAGRDGAGPGDGIPPAIPFAQDPSGARRYGRALVEAACAEIARAGRPLHAGEILERLQEQGFTLPGHDPVAALNTRLWKRAAPGGPLRRVAEATYALAPEDGAGA